MPGKVRDGPWFLRHLERTETLLHVLAPSVEENIAEQLINDYKIVRRELAVWTWSEREKGNRGGE